MPEMKTKWRGSSVQKVTQEQSPSQKVVNMCRLPRAAHPKKRPWCPVGGAGVVSLSDDVFA